MNVYDSDRMRSILTKKGFIWEPSLAEADVVLINTCSIRAKSEQKVLSLLGQLKPLKQRAPDKVFGITGCVGQRMGRQLLQRVPHLDLVMGPDGVERVGDVVAEVVERGKRVLETELDGKERSYVQPALPVSSDKPVQYITVMKGCDHFCTYCIVPFVRGREKSRSISEILCEVRQWVEKGTKEITFLGQNINTYGKGTGESLAQLIEGANGIEGLERIRYVTSHPRDMGEDLIQQFGRIEKLCPALHLPFQSGSDAVLKRMSRLYNRQEYVEKVTALKKACPHIALSTDVIVGFPGESESDFEQSLSLLKDLGFSQVFSFNYSPRPGTKAFSYQDQVPDEIKSERLQRLQNLVQSTIEKENKGYRGRTVSVLIESMDKKKRYYMGRTPSNKVVHVLNAGSACVGKIIDVEISEAVSSNLKGYYVGAPRTDRFAEAAISASV